MRILYARNTDYLHDLDANKYPRFARAPVMKHVARFGLKMIQALATIAVQTTIITISGTNPDGDYTPSFTGTDALGVAFDIELDAFAASGDDEEAIAAGIEAIIETAIGVELAGLLTSADVTGAVITLVWEPGVTVTSSVEVPVGAVATIARSFSAVVTPATRLGGWPVMPVFYEHVIRASMILHRLTAIAGLAAVTIIGGDANDDNGLLTSTSLAAAGTVQTAAAERQRRYEAAFTPQYTIVSTTDQFSSATAGEFMVELEYTPVPETAHAGTI
jgi:hypothetical protein